MPYQQELSEGPVVAIWAGDLDDENAVAEYIGQPFEKDFGFLLDQDDLPEVANSPDESPGRSQRNPPLQRVDIRELLAAFSGSDDWLDEAERLCRKAGLDSAKVVIVFRHLRYREELGRNVKAPLRFIANLPWTGGNLPWEAKIKSRLLSPPFPLLVRKEFDDGDLVWWGGRIHLEQWKGFAAREALEGGYGELRFSSRPDGDLLLAVMPLDNKRSREPTPAQARAFKHLLDNERAIKDAVLQGIFEEYGAWRELYEWPEDMPEISRPDQLVRLIRPATVYLLAKDIEGLSRVGFSFGCKWDEEHGLGVLTHKGRVVEVGQEDAAYNDP